MVKVKRGKKWYRPKEIAELGLIKNTRNSDKILSNYDYILRLIRNGKLAARDYCTTDQHYWMVSEDEIARYNDEF
jgi:hypothetical protein